MKRRIIVEGPSERAYMQRLMSFLESDMPLDFEDFLALHFESELFNRWKASLNQNQHFAVPLHGDDYDALWRPVWKDFLDVHSEVGQGAYKKGSLPEGFVSLASLRNLCENVRDPMMAGIFAKHSSSSAPAFPVWLADTLRQIYPEEFS